jgi:uncharacterized protein
MDQTAAFIAVVFVIGGLIKGVVGLGLPAFAMGILVIAMPPAEAASILIVPSLVTNVWQLLAGPSVTGIIQRLWPMMAGVVAGTLCGTGWLAGGHAKVTTALLGAALAVYSLTALVSVRLHVRPDQERWAGPLVGVLTGLMTAATGVFAIPAVAYLQAIGLEKEDLVQALGLSFTVATLALAVNLAEASVLTVSDGPVAILALGSACAGLAIGQAVRSRLEPALFRMVFLSGLLLLGGYLIARALLLSP